MAETVSCGGVVIHKGKVLLLYKNQGRKYVGWVLPKGQLEEDENLRQAAIREVREESRVVAKILKYLGKTSYSFRGWDKGMRDIDPDDIINKTVHWYLMSSGSFFCRPQHEENFADAGFYKKHEAFHLLKFNDEKQIILRAYEEYEILLKRMESRR
ncbi:MAG: NUDIX domain-containing protein [Defluviitaleaceae bacterium]|nr:NUDIX domain-containing protein [Defluviitaleaceae bacterium]